MIIFNKEIDTRSSKSDCWYECSEKHHEDTELFYLCMTECGTFEKLL